MLALQAAALLLLGVALCQPAAVPEDLKQSSAQAPVLDAVKNRFQYRRLGYLPPPPRPGRMLRASPVEELYVEQILDHFTVTDKRTWQQRYFKRTDMYEDGGPVFIYIGGESQEGASRLADFGLYLTYMAQLLRAKTYSLEHRYYGKSHPLPDLTTASLQYLSADQALADLAYFIEFLKKSGEIEDGQPVAVFGGSYPGNLAAWARQKYPHLIKTAISSSAPVHAKADFVEYMEVVGRSLNRVAGEFCFNNIKKATDRVVELLKTTEGYATVKKVFRMSTELKDKLDLDAFFETLSSPFAGAVQYNRDHPPKSVYSIKYICSFMAGDDLTPDEAMSKLSKLVLGEPADPNKTFDWSYKSSIKQYQRTEYVQDKSGEFSSDRQWIYQTCTEFGYYQTFSGKDIPFPSGYNDIQYSYQTCKDLFGDDFDEKLITGAVERSNLVFGDRSPDVTNVLYINGNVDPWHALGILRNVSATKAPAFVVDGGSHCADMDYPDDTSDSDEIKAAHEMVHQFLRTTLYEVPDGQPADG
ncbi:putative serine protease K12H4.7 [Thrips palmi]|uniref:Serine protease K12H4.7 n=1 Tax=Thrips palmi TaxID=161013 RepID=A0A6P8YES0_THRPL|nr:putative serine protease K12H4.7 [Thrips palmi]